MICNAKWQPLNEEAKSGFTFGCCIRGLGLRRKLLQQQTLLHVRYEMSMTSSQVRMGEGGYSHPGQVKGQDRGVTPNPGYPPPIQVRSQMDGGTLLVRTGWGYPPPVR